MDIIGHSARPGKQSNNPFAQDMVADCPEAINENGSRPTAINDPNSKQIQEIIDTRFQSKETKIDFGWLRRPVSSHLSNETRQPLTPNPFEGIQPFLIPNRLECIKKPLTPNPFEGIKKPMTPNPFEEEPDNEVFQRSQPEPEVTTECKVKGSKTGTASVVCLPPEPSDQKNVRKSVNVSARNGCRDFYHDGRFQFLMGALLCLGFVVCFRLFLMMYLAEYNLRDDDEAAEAIVAANFLIVALVFLIGLFWACVAMFLITCPKSFKLNSSMTSCKKDQSFEPLLATQTSNNTYGSDENIVFYKKY